MESSSSFKLLVRALFVWSAIILVGCGDDVPLTPGAASEEPVETPVDDPSEEEVKEPEPPINDPVETEDDFEPFFSDQDVIINKAVNNFDIDLFKAMICNPQIAAKFPNPAISPLSLTFALSMSANTFDNQFASEVLSKLKSDSLAQLNMYFRRLMASMPEGGNVKLANSAWYFDGLVAPSAAYSSNLSKAYSAPVNPIDFSNTHRAASLINGWVADNTSNLIDRIINPGDLENAVVVLANSLIFDGKWAHQFDEKLTKKDVFHGKNGDADIDFLHNNEQYSYGETSTYKVISMPLDDFGFYDLLVFVPKDGETIGSVIERLDADEISRLEYQMALCKVDLSIPKFNSELNDKCTDLLEAVGINMHRPHTLFGFTGDASTPFDNQISETFHAAKMSINEKGALAASATVMVIMSGWGPGCPYEPEEVTLKVDCPFFYLLRYRSEGSILIAGCFTQP